jgi:hypothetical protein
MIEIKSSNTWWSPRYNVVPTTNLSALDVKRLADRQALIDRARLEIGQTRYWVKINNGLFKGTIFQVEPETNRYVRSSAKTFSAAMALAIEPTNRKAHGPLHYVPDGMDPAQKPDWANESVYMQFNPGNMPIRFKEGTFYPFYLPGNVIDGVSLLLDYTGGEVFCMNEGRRPATFTDRLDHEVKVGDLVVVALNYGAGLEICMVRGYADETRVIIESVHDGSVDRIPLENNSTSKIMRMPNKLEDMAMMMKLARI